MLVGVDPLENVEGEYPWLDGDPLRPNEKYFAHVDRIVALCSAYEGLVLVVGVYHTVRMKGAVNAANARPWARWVGRRYKDVPGIVWSMYPRAVPEDVGVCRELARGLREGDGGLHPITAHPDPSPASSSTILHGEPWLAFNSIQVFSHVELIHPMVTGDRGLRPAKPVVMAEGFYEDGEGYGIEVVPLWLRRQAYYSYLAGGFHTYGHDDYWRLRASWRRSLESPGARQMGILKKILLARKEWWRLVPDQGVLVSGGRTDGPVLNLAARHPEGRWAVIYAAGPSRLSVAMSRLGAACEGFWIDPRTGDPGERIACPNSGVREFTTPAGWEDALLVLEAHSGA
jgi:hypothetical protein